MRDTTHLSLFDNAASVGVLHEVESCGSEAWSARARCALGFSPGPAWPDRFGRSLRAWSRAHLSRDIPVLSLFSGGGGLDIAFHDAGFSIVEMVEIEKSHVATLSANATQSGYLGSARVRCMDIRDYDPSSLGVEVVIGGPPCQSFSAAGRRAAGVQGTSDSRGTLFEEYARLLSQLKPRVFLFENVYGLTGAQGGEAWHAVQEKFAQVGYKLFWRILDTADFGVPQHRERLFVIGLRDGEYLFPAPTHGPDAKPPQPFYTAREAVQGANNNHSEEKALRGTNIGGRFGHLIAAIPPGLNYSFYTPEMGHPSPVFAWRSKFSDFMYKADPETPVRTLKAQAGLYTGPFSWECRHFTVAEMKRLQTFPDDYVLIGNRATCLAQIGNSVPPQIGRLLAMSILEQVFNIAPPFPTDYLAPSETLGFRRRKRALTERYAAKAQAAIKSSFPDNRNGNDERATVSESDDSDNELADLPETQWKVSQWMEARWLTPKHGLGKKGIGDSCDPQSVEIRLKYSAGDKELYIQGAVPKGEANKIGSTASYEIVVRPVAKAFWPMSWPQARLRGSTSHPLIFSALWKALEEVIAEQCGIADLVQLCGYYQYAPRIIACLKYASPTSCLSSEWQVLPHLVSGGGVSSQLNAERLADLWEMEPRQIPSALRFLRGIGYEVRSHRTNPQMADGEYLIPYCFPTLNPRSIQGRKAL